MNVNKVEEERGIEAKDPPAVQMKPATEPVKKKRKRSELMFKKQEGQTLVKKPGDLDGSMFVMADLKDCAVFILDHTSTMTIDRCENCTFIIGPVKQSFFIRDNTKNCKVIVSCGQFRCR